MEEIIRTGGCLCGAVRFSARGAPKFISNCHCQSCRKASSAPSMTWAGFLDAQVQIEGDSVRRYASSPGVTRSFCANCGSPIAYQGERWAGETHLPVCAFDDASDLAPTTDHCKDEKLPWAKPLAQGAE